MLASETKYFRIPKIGYLGGYEEENYKDHFADTRYTAIHNENQKATYGLLEKEADL